MRDSFEFTLNSPLTKEDWDTISDVEHENTKYITFQTPQGRQVRYVKCSVLDKIRAEIEIHCSIRKKNHCRYCSSCYSVMWVREILEIIDKCEAERESSL